MRMNEGMDVLAGPVEASRGLDRELGQGEGRRSLRVKRDELHRRIDGVVDVLWAGIQDKRSVLARRNLS